MAGWIDEELAILKHDECWWRIHVRFTSLLIPKTTKESPIHVKVELGVASGPGYA